MKKFWSKKIRELLRQFSNASLKFFLYAFTVLPRGCVDPIIRILFWIAYPWLETLKKICKKNFSAVYGESKTPEQYEVMIRACFDNLGQSMVDMLYYASRSEEFLNALTFHGEENLKESLKKGCGVVGVTAHFGNFPLMLLGLVKKGYKVNVVIRSMRDQEFSNFMLKFSARWSIQMIPTSPQKNFIKKTLACLRRNELLFILLDEVAPEDSGVEVDFLNCKVARSVGPVLFNERIGSSLVPMFIARDDQGKFDIFIEKEIEIENKLSSEENTFKNISSLSQSIESFVKKYPLQWGGWLNKRWASFFS